MRTTSSPPNTAFLAHVDPDSTAVYLTITEDLLREADKRSRALVPCEVCLANCYEGRYYRQIAPRKGDASLFLNGPDDSETIGAAKRTRQWNVRDGLDFCHFQYPQVGLPLVEPIKRIVIGTEEVRHPASPSKGAVEHPTKAAPSIVPAWTPKPMIRRVY